MSMSARYNILFLCTANSARSVLAESIMNREGAAKFTAYSAGSMPSGRINPHAVHLLESLNYKTGQLRSKSWEEFARPDAPRLDFVITVCNNAAGEVCPVWPGQPIQAHWGVPDPAAAEGSEAEVSLAFADAYRQLYNRITIFSALPIESLDRLALERKMDEIGATRDTPARA
jgi:arsenate reductase